ncbi:pimeloyl-ACP methyl ester carboxylesterase [Paenibacillus taihuensis]|uniref:Pimeloyl-ACP methyl ester carboxylesterase n=1 Tax=Paenibacillus taihuensis TaxID=1156355 RepID=A0A3D9SB56_9BACL|nr:alpha/beta hydrolase [Paenibacillus taihuensis]REE90507.1 pimeloyl-ACP methyl ester carboxylesterase [Paenibacillus taihuensis]
MGRYVEVEKDVKLYVEDIGAGRPVIFVHGWPVNHRMFEYQYNVLPKYGFRCIGIDLRGYGKSDAPWSGYDYDRMSDDIAVVADTLGLLHATLVGFSMGGALAIRYAARHYGRRLCGIVLAAAAAPVFTQRPDFPYGTPVEQINKSIAGLYTDRPKTVADFGMTFFAKPISDPFRTWFNGLGFDASSYGTIKGLESLRDEDLRGDLANVQLPTTILHGKLDAIAPYALAEQMNKGIQGSKLVPFEQSGHGLFYDEREKFNQELLNALGGK